MTKCEPSMFHCHRRAAGGGFLSLLLAVLMIAVVAEMRSRWQSRAAAAAFPDLLSRQAALKPPDSLSFSLCETCEKFNLIWAVWPGVYLVKLMACSCDLKGIGVFSSSEIKDANELLGTFGADPGQENIFCCGYSLSLLLLYKKKNKAHTTKEFIFRCFLSSWPRKSFEDSCAAASFFPLHFSWWWMKNKCPGWLRLCRVLINRMVGSWLWWIRAT